MKKKPNTRANKIMRSKKINKLIMIGVIAVIAIVIGISVASIRMPANAAAPIDGIECNTMEQSIFHIHAQLNMFINGKNYTVPPLIGITNYCLYWMHTHDNSGIIHIESPVNRTFDLGHFFDIWKQKFNNTQVLNNTADANHPVSVYVNGTKVPNSINYRDIALHAHDIITIVYGQTPSPIPNKADFTAVDPQQIKPR